jgi:hypothetical protein
MEHLKKITEIRDELIEYDDDPTTQELNDIIEKLNNLFEYLNNGLNFQEESLLNQLLRHPKFLPILIEHIDKNIELAIENGDIYWGQLLSNLKIKLCQTTN